HGHQPAAAQPRGAAGPPVEPTVPPRPIGHTRLLLVLLLCVLNAAISGLLLLQHHGEGRAVAAVNQVCGAGADSGCEQVAHSRFAQFRRLPLGGIGVLFYGSLAILLLLALLSGPETRAAAAAIALLALT